MRQIRVAPGFVALLGALLISTPTWAVEGDVNGDSHVTVADAICTLLVVLTPGTPPGCLGPAGSAAADVNCDSSTNVSDVQLVVRLALGLGLPLELDSAPANGLVDACESAPSDLVPADYVQVYELGIPNGPPFWNSYGDIPYSLDDSGALAGTSFDRIGYLLELAGGASPGSIFVSMDAFTSNVAQTGVPIDWGFQQSVSRMSVESDVAGIPALTLASGGNIEFWSSCYATAPDAFYDSADTPSNGLADDCFGSMQVHHNGATLFAFNSWSWDGGSNSISTDLGIGVNTQPGPTVQTDTAHPDWTFRQNADAYTLKRLSVFIRPAPLGHSQATAAVSCKAIRDAGADEGDGSYWLDPDGDNDPSDAFQAYCRMDALGGGWTLCAAFGHQVLGANTAAGLQFTHSVWNTAGTVFLRH